MSITLEHTMEGLSRAYVAAIAHRAGVMVSLGETSFDYGIDGSFRSVQVFDGGLVEAGPVIRFQLKSTYAWNDHANHIAYDLGAAAYNRIVFQDKKYLECQSSTPTLLLVLCLPREQTEWLEVSEDKILMRRCCYWALVRGEPTDNVSSKTIHLPKSQRLTPDSINALLVQAGEGEF